jgi:hypothetical protein
MNSCPNNWAAVLPLRFAVAALFIEPFPFGQDVFIFLSLIFPSIHFRVGFDDSSVAERGAPTFRMMTLSISTLSLTALSIIGLMTFLVELW